MRSGNLTKQWAKFADVLCHHTFRNKMNEATLLYLDNIRLFKPTADADTILQLESFLDKWQTDTFPEELSNILNKIITRQEHRVPDFDFRKIESLTASKSFGRGFTPRINGSWFSDMQAWGRGMFPGENLRSETPADWNHNIWHIEHEGFSRNQPLRVTYYEWYDRYVASNSGGSHHAAKVIYQASRDKLSYNRDAVIEHLTLCKNAIQELDKLFYSFIFITNNNDGRMQAEGDTWFRAALNNLVSHDVHYLRPMRYPENVKFAFIAKKSLKVHEDLFENWMNLASRAEKIIIFPEYLNSPAKFHTKSYLHEVNSIFLGAPF